MIMPRTVDEILQHADELAARFESYEPNQDDELDTGAVADSKRQSRSWSSCALSSSRAASRS